MRSKFEIVTPAADPHLLTLEQARVLAGLEADDDSRDENMEFLRARITADIHNACRVRGDGIRPPTLRQETIRETFRLGTDDDTIFLSRLFVTSVASVVEAGNALSTDDVHLDGEAGLLQRISAVRNLAWRRGTAVIEYVAGFADVPPDLAGIAMDLARLRLSAEGADPLVKATTIEIPDIETTRVDRWVGAVPGSSVGPVPADIMARLGRYANAVVA